MNEQIAYVFVIFLYILIGLIVVRAFMSWFPSMQGSEFARFVHRVTEPLIEPVRRYMPAMGGFDFSPIIVIVVLQLMVAVVNQVADR